MRRSEVRRLRLPRSTGREQHGVRYAVIVQSDTLLPRSVVLIAPTSTGARPATTRPEIEIGGTKTRVLVEQTKAVDVGRLGDAVGSLSREEQWSVDDALRAVLGLD